MRRRPKRITFKGLKWVSVGYAVHVLANGLIEKYGDRVHKAPGVYGPARGGLPLAVAMSHALRLPLLRTPRDGCVWIDDIIDSGHTLWYDRKRAKGMMPCAWVVKHGCKVLHVRAVDDNVWTIFPWEDPAFAKESAKEYAASRQ